tara:strand:+ start:774 stop:947 length:174 start_codon:yes stop_codon:yes gene_type:complete
MEWSNCCGAEPSYLSDDKCGECLENAVFEEQDDEEELIQIPIDEFMEWLENTNQTIT